MHIQYDKTTDQLYIGLREGAAAPEHSGFVSENVYADRDPDLNIVGFDIEHASTLVDLTTLIVDGMSTD